MNSIFDLIDAKALDEYLATVNTVFPIDEPSVRARALATVKHYKDEVAQLPAIKELERRWYDSLKQGAPDYTVYDSEDYFMSDAGWGCWVLYSRKYLRQCKSILPIFRDVTSVADLGCGFGYTTAALKELFPHAHVYGTNVLTSHQFKVATKIGSMRGFTVVPQIERADVVFASEYFEHFQRPLEHLLDVIRIGQPKYFIIANAFGARAIGHFDEYITQAAERDTIVPTTKIGRLFNDVLRNSGYERVETGFWNNRPAVWQKKAQESKQL